MKKVLLVGGVLLSLVLVLLVAGSGAWFYLSGTHFYFQHSTDRQTEEFARRTIEQVFANWNNEKFIRRANERFFQTTPREQLQRLFRVLEDKLGTMHWHNGIQKSQAVKSVGKNGQTTAQFLTYATYEKGEARIRLSLVRQDQTWEILGFNVNSQSLLQTRS